MGSTHQADFADKELFKREVGLEAHIKCNFFPPHPPYVVTSMIAGFKKYWAGEINLDELREACYLRTMDGLYRYFGCFLDEEEYDG